MSELTDGLRHHGQWLPWKTTTLNQATSLFTSNECVWVKARVLDAALKVNVSFDMCTHPAGFDRHLSKVIQERGCVECDDVAFVLKALADAASPKVPATLVDLGANIGMFSLPAAAAGNDVVSFEPMPSNIVRLLASGRRSGLMKRIHLVSLCVSDLPGARLCHLGLNPTNQGHLRHKISSSNGTSSTASGATAPAAADELADGHANGLLTSAAVRVDDVLPPQRRPFVLKVDLEGGECRAFRGMSRLLNESSRLAGALIEWDKSRACCPELITPPHGAFAIMHQRHGLCVHAGKSTTPLPSLEALCRTDFKLHSKQLNLRWRPCAKEPLSGT